MFAIGFKMCFGQSDNKWTPTWRCLQWTTCVQIIATSPLTCNVQWFGMLSPKGTIHIIYITADALQTTSASGCFHPDPIIIDAFQNKV